MDKTKIWNNHYQKKFKEVSAVHKRTATFFRSTQSHKISYKITKYEKTIKDLGAADLQRLRLFFVVKGHNIAFYRSRAPPSDFEIH